MHYGRTAHTASLLLDGKLLVTGGGGVNEYEILNTCELYDPSTGNWTKTHDMHYSRMWHTATVLTNGTVLVTSGLNSYLYLRRLTAIYCSKTTYCFQLAWLPSKILLLLLPTDA